MTLTGDKYETQEEVEFRLKETIVLYEGRPVYIHRVSFPEEEDKGEIARVFFWSLPLGKKQEHRRYLSSRKFDLSPFKMGYMNHGGEAVFVSRVPNRQNKQGLSAANCSITNIHNKPSDVVDFNTLVRSPGFTDMVDNAYPKFDEVVNKLGERNYSSVALSKSFAVYLDHNLETLLLLHKGVKCGIALSCQEGFKLPGKFRFLKEEAEECGIPLLKI